MRDSNRLDQSKVRFVKAVDRLLDAARIAQEERDRLVQLVATDRGGDRETEQAGGQA